MLRDYYILTNCPWQFFLVGSHLSTHHRLTSCAQCSAKPVESTYSFGCGSLWVMFFIEAAVFLRERTCLKSVIMSCSMTWHSPPQKKHISKWITTLSVKYKRSHNFMVRGNYIPSRLQKILQPQQFNSSIAPIHLCHLQKLHGHFRPPEPWQKIWPVEWPPKIRENPFFKVR